MNWLSFWNQNLIDNVENAIGILKIWFDYSCVVNNHFVIIKL